MNETVFIGFSRSHNHYNKALEFIDCSTQSNMREKNTHLFNPESFVEWLCGRNICASAVNSANNPIVCVCVRAERRRIKIILNCVARITEHATRPFLQPFHSWMCGALQFKRLISVHIDKSIKHTTKAAISGCHTARAHTAPNKLCPRCSRDFLCVLANAWLFGNC